MGTCEADTIGYHSSTATTPNPAFGYAPDRILANAGETEHKAAVFCIAPEVLLILYAAWFVVGVSWAIDTFCLLTYLVIALNLACCADFAFALYYSLLCSKSYTGSILYYGLKDASHSQVSRVPEIILVRYRVRTHGASRR